MKRNTGEGISERRQGRLVLRLIKKQKQVSFLPQKWRGFISVYLPTAKHSPLNTPDAIITKGGVHGRGLMTSSSFDPERVKLHSRNSSTYRSGLLPPGNAGGASHQHLHVAARLLLLTLDLRLAVVVVPCKQASKRASEEKAAAQQSDLEPKHLHNCWEET